MRIFAIGDLHFGFAVKKPMDIFGEHWKNHAEKVIQNWKAQIQPEDVVLIPGDISWAMRMEQAAVDLNVIDQLPGRKILLPGNHEYWWKSVSKLSAQYPNMDFLKNNSIRLQKDADIFICGTRGWTCPNDVDFSVEDRKIYEREQVRLRLSLDEAMWKGAKEILVMLHFPPVNEKHEPSAFTEILSQYPVRLVVYGHLHGAANHRLALQGEYEGISYHLTASDYLDFTPKYICNYDFVSKRLQ